MNYTVITIKGTDYRCRLNARNCVELEKKLGKNPINVFTALMGEASYPRVEEMVLIFHASLQAYNHKISLDDAYELFDDYVEEGHTIIDFIPFLLEVFKVSGFFPSDDEVEENPNA